MTQMADNLRDFAPSASEPDVRVRGSLKSFAVLASICTSTGTLLYCYDYSLAAWRGALIWVHDATGDLSILVLGVYLYQHLSRTWSLRRGRSLSWWSGMVGLAAWLAAGVTGVWGQFVTIERYSALWWVHSMGSLASVVVVCAHAAYGYQARASSIRS